MTHPENLAIYIHWPFCKSKCPYCDFNSHVVENIDENRWLNAYLKEIDSFSDNISGRRISSIFFGGGTASLMPPFIAEALINKLAKYAPFANDIEITLEGNPTSVEAAKYKDFHEAGINRVSLGVQALNDDDLKFLGREHSAKEALEAVQLAAYIFDNYSFDLIYARPNQTEFDWKKELKEALKCAGGHLSLYQLAIEKGTPFYADYNRGKFKMPNNELSARLYEITSEITSDAGILQYEVSNYAKKSLESKHNMTYWEYGDYLGFGAGAHSRIKINGQKNAITMLHKPEKWLSSIYDKGSAIQSFDSLSPKCAAEEALMMGLRINKGINWDVFERETGFVVDREKFINDTKFLQNEGLVKVSCNSVKASSEGLALLNSLLSKLVDYL